MPFKSQGPLRVNPANPRYFTDDSGESIYLTGSHTWGTLVDLKLEGQPDFDYPAFLDVLEHNGHNFMRLWTWDHPEWGPWTNEKVLFDPMPHARTGPGLAADGKPKFDLSQWNELYFERLRQRVIEAGERGIYVSVMLFEGWCLRSAYAESDPWPNHPYNIQNNINGVAGTVDANGRGQVYTMDVPEVVSYQEAYVRKVIETVNDLDHIMYEIVNETPCNERSIKWHHHMINFIHDVEKGMPKQHPVGMTSEGGIQDNPILFESPAEWISPGRGPDSEYKYNPPAATGAKVVLTDTDHLWGHGGNYPWAWKSFLRGLNPLFMDPWGPVPGSTRPGYPSNELNSRHYPDWALLRANMGHTLRYAKRLDLNRALPHGELAASRYCLAEPGVAYLVYVPDDAQVVLDLSDAQGPLAVEWFSPRTSECVQDSPVMGGKPINFVSPFGMDVVLFVYARNAKQ
jgi:hypothetical protein